MIKKWIAVFLVFFLGMSGFLLVDQSCRETLGKGGNPGLSITKTEKGNLSISFFGIGREIPL